MADLPSLAEIEARQSAEDVPVLVAALRAVLANHGNATGGSDSCCRCCEGPRCTFHPCETWTALTAHLTLPEET